MALRWSSSKFPNRLCALIQKHQIDKLTIHRQAAQAGKGRACLGLAAMVDGPTTQVWPTTRTEEENQGGCDLRADERQPYPAGMLLKDHLAYIFVPVFDPEGGHDAKSDRQLLERYQGVSYLRRSHLRAVDGHDHRHMPCRLGSRG